MVFGICNQVRGSFINDVTTLGGRGIIMDFVALAHKKRDDGKMGSKKSLIIV